jgi:superfamily II DNA helicase RecQ
VRANFVRPNLFLTCVEYKKEKIQKPKKKKGDIPPIKDISDIKDDIDMKLLRPFFDKYRNDKIIIYTNSRQMTLNISNEINSNHPDGRVSEAYHAGMSKGLREKVQTKFSTGDIRIIVSTVAFGMGVDQIVRCVIIIGAPSSIEEYWQQIGRAGRDNLPAETILFYQYRSIVIASSMLEKECKNPMIKRNKKRNLFKMGEYFYLKTCRRKYVLKHFNQPPKFFTCSMCDNCTEKELTDITPIVWSMFYKENIKTPQFDKNEIEFIKKNLKNPKYNKINNVFMEMDLITWKKYIDKKKYNLNDIPDNLKIRIFYKDIYTKHLLNTTNLFEKDDFSKLEEMYENLII